MTNQFLSSRRNGDAIRRCTFATVTTALLMLAPVAGAHSTSDTATPQGQQLVPPLREQQQDTQQHKTERQKEAHSNILERKALAAHQPSDTGPVENWFGCPPKRDPNATRAPDSEVSATRSGETERGESVCDPEAAANDSPQKKDSKY